MSKKVVTLDVREDLRQGREPFSLIMRAVQQLKANEALRLIAPFEPKPLFAVMANNGFGHTSKVLEDGGYEVLFERSEAAGPAPKPVSFPAAPPCRAKLIEVDARGLEPPQPLVKILEALENLPPGVEMRAHTDRRPMHLLTQLEERGFNGVCEEQTDGSYLTQINHR